MSFSNSINDRNAGWLWAPDGRLRLGWRILLGFSALAVALLVAGVVGDASESWFDRTIWLNREVVQAVVVAGLTIPLIILLRLRADRRSLADIGFSKPLQAAGYFLFGAGMLAGVMGIPLLIMSAMGWLEVSIDISHEVLMLVTISIVVAFLFEALPEEVVVRGYLYRNLSAAMARWLASLVTLALFLLLPVVIAMTQQIVSGEEQQLLSLGYFGLLIPFGIVLQYLRVVTGNVWTCIGFHLAFLQMARHMGPREDAVIQLLEFQEGAPVDAVLQGVIILAFVFLLLYPWIFRRPVCWRERDPE